MSWQRNCFHVKVKEYTYEYLYAFLSLIYLLSFQKVSKVILGFKKTSLNTSLKIFGAGDVAQW